MKINKIFITAVTALFLVASCSEERLNEMPVDKILTEDLIKSERDMEMMVNGIYSSFSSSAVFGANALIFGDLVSDNTFISKIATDTAFRNTGELNWSGESSDFGGLLRGFYSAIVNANLVINNKSLEENDVVLNYKGEAKIARGLALFYAVSFYSPDPKSGVYQEFGVPLNLNNYDPEAKLKRASVEEVYVQVIKDLTEGIDMMTNELPGNSKGHLSPTAAKLLLSRVYLTRGQAGDYQKAVGYADEVIASAGTFERVSKADYAKYFTSQDPLVSENQPETVWEINMNDMPGGNPGVNDALASLYANNGAKKRFLFRANFRNSFVGNGDVRKGLLILGAAPIDDNPKGVWTTKYVKDMRKGPSGSKAEYSQNVKVLRMSEANLNRIEARFKLHGASPDLLAELNAFAQSRGGQTYTSVTIENILTERKKEFFGEGQRFFDLKRNGLGFSNTDNCYSVICDVPSTSKVFVFPMPLTELNSNPNMTQYPLY